MEYMDLVYPLGSIKRINYNLGTNESSGYLDLEK